MADYFNIFKGLDCLPGNYHIEVDPTSHQVLVHLKPQFKNKIVEMEQERIIAPITKSIEWMSSLMSVLCLANFVFSIQSIKCQPLMLPKVENAKVFTLNICYFQIILDKPRLYLTCLLHFDSFLISTVSKQNTGGIR